MFMTTTDLKVEYEVLGIVREAKDMGANAIIGIRYASSQVAAGMAEIVVYGTAVKI